MSDHTAEMRAHSGAGERQWVPVPDGVGRWWVADSGEVWRRRVVQTHDGLGWLGLVGDSRPTPIASLSGVLWTRELAHGEPPPEPPLLEWMERTAAPVTRERERAAYMTCQACGVPCPIEAMQCSKCVRCFAKERDLALKDAEAARVQRDALAAKLAEVETLCNRTVAAAGVGLQHVSDRIAFLTHKLAEAERERDALRDQLAVRAGDIPRTNDGDQPPASVTHAEYDRARAVCLRHLTESDYDPLAEIAALCGARAGESALDAVRRVVLQRDEARKEAEQADRSDACLRADLSEERERLAEVRSQARRAVASLVAVIGDEGPNTLIWTVNRAVNHIASLRQQRDTLWAELRQIRAFVDADADEATADAVKCAVRSLVLQRDEARNDCRHARLDEVAAREERDEAKRQLAARKVTP